VVRNKPANQNIALIARVATKTDQESESASKVKYLIFCLLTFIVSFRLLFDSRLMMKVVKHQVALQRNQRNKFPWEQTLSFLGIPAQPSPIQAMQTLLLLSIIQHSLQTLLMLTVMNPKIRLVFK
jgi:hypothetical protein